MPKLLIFLSEEQPPLQYAVPGAKDAETLAIIPAEDVLLTQTSLPKMSRARFQQALPFALEEQLVADIDKQHFVATAKDDELWAVAVIAKDKMQLYRAQLAELKLAPSQMQPASLLLPVKEGEWSIGLFGSKAMVRCDATTGFGCDRENLQAMLQVALSAVQSLPQRIIIRNYTPCSVLAELTAPVPLDETMLSAEQFLPDLAVGPVNAALNLLQGSFATTKSRRNADKKLIYLAGALTAVGLILVIAYPTVSYFLLKQRLDTIHTQIAAIYKRNFPTATNMVAPKLRMEEKLHKISSQGQESQFLLLLGQFAKALNGQQQIALTRFDFQNNQLNVNITAATSEDLSNFNNTLSEQGLRVKQQNADLNNGHINATLVVE